MLSITATELKNNLSAYLGKASSEDIIITQYGKMVARLTAPYTDRVAAIDALVGSIPQGFDEEDAKRERAAAI